VALGHGIRLLAVVTIKCDADGSLTGHFKGKMANCAYCGQDGKVTREEVMPLFLSRNRPAYRTVLDHGRRLVRTGIVAAVRDVCEDCNGVTLSGLDAYAADLDRTYLSRIVGFSPTVEFHYEYKLLLRWLLKVTYNDDRTRPPPYETKPFVPFILGHEAEPPFAITVLLGLITPGVTPREQQAKGFPKTMEPESCGIGYLWYDQPAKRDIAFSRFVQINSYLFDVIAWHAGVSRPGRRRHVAKICQIHRLFELRPADKSVVISTGMMDYLTFQTRFFERTAGYRDIRT
jgi:hypothetical protein